MPLSPSSMASSIPHLYSNYSFTYSDHLSDQFPIPSNTSFMDNNNNNNTMWGCHQDSLFPVVDNNGALDHIVSLDCDTLSSTWMPTFSEQLAAGAINNSNSDNNLAISDCKMGFYGGIAAAGFQNFNSRFQPHIGDFGDECCGFLEDIKPPNNSYPNTAATRENWGIQGNQIAAVEEPNIKVGRYSEEERKERILRYLKKRNQRNFNKTIKYACRKTLADRRVRVRGRFARNNELCDQEDNMATKKHHKLDHHDFYGADSFQFQLKNEEEDWLQEAMASLVYLSHSSPEDM